jgi:hypothetical protein
VVLTSAVLVGNLKREYRNRKFPIHKNIVNRLRAERSKFDSRQGQEFFSSPSSRPALRLTGCSVGTDGSYPGDKSTRP